MKDCTIAGFTECLNSDLDPNDTGTAFDWGVFKRVRCDVGTFTGSHVCHSFGEGASVTGMTVHNDVYSNRYEDCESVLASNAQTQYGWLFGWCDSTICDHPSVQGTPTGTAIAFAFQYGVNPALSAKVPADIESVTRMSNTTTASPTPRTSGRLRCPWVPSRAGSSTRSR